MRVYLESDVECTVDGVGLLEPGKAVEVDVAAFQLFHGVTPSQANFPRTITVIYDTDRDDAGSAVESTDNTEPPATNIGSGNDEETHQDAGEEA